MNKALLSIFFLLVLLLTAACSREEPAEEATAEPLAQEEQAPAGDPTAPADETPDGEAQEVLQVVEESAAEAEESGDDELLLARADTGEAAASATNYQYKEGTHYTRLVPSQPTIGSNDKVEVAEFFWYGCPHCFDLEPTINAWSADLPPSVRFVRVPAVWNNPTSLHAQLFYTEEVLGRNGDLKDPEAFHQTVFEEYHRRGNRLLNKDSIQALFARYDVSSEAFDQAWGSFEVAQKLRVAQDLGRRYGVSSVPMVIVNGKYRTSAGDAGSYPKLLEVMDELIDREGAD